jgi:hypothetical protein
MLETSLIRARSQCRLQKWHSEAQDNNSRSISEKTNTKEHVPTNVSFILKAMLTTTETSNTPPTREKHWKFLTLFGNHTQRPYRRQATTAPNKLATKCSSAIQLKTLFLDTKLRPKRNNPQRSGRKLYFLNAIPASELSCNETIKAKISNVVDETYD